MIARNNQAAVQQLLQDARNEVSVTCLIALLIFLILKI